MSPVAANQVVDRCDSTNDLARGLGEQGAPHGSWISARIQEKGRGRLGREWQSVEGNLFLSLVARLSEKSLWTWVPLGTAVAVARTLTAAYPTLDIRIKWPNDLWVGGAKLGGILCEAVGGREGSFLVIGLGLNCAYAPEGLDQATVSLSAALAPQRLIADDIRADIIRTLLGTLHELSTEGTWGIVRDYERWAALKPGSAIEWGENKTGIVRGLGPSGELLVDSEEGVPLRLYAEDVRVRFRKASGESRP
jgi:biotin-[acetyl-CoA-carboxylase] ligase BirA-like protein